MKECYEAKCGRCSYNEDDMCMAGAYIGFEICPYFQEKEKVSIKLKRFFEKFMQVLFVVVFVGLIVGAVIGKFYWTKKSLEGKDNSVSAVIRAMFEEDKKNGND